MIVYIPGVSVMMRLAILVAESAVEELTDLAVVSKSLIVD